MPTRGGKAATRKATAGRAGSARSKPKATSARKKAGRTAGTRSPKTVEKKLTTYYRKRDFAVTPEPTGGETVKARLARKGADLPRFVVQQHDATRLHWDFRLEAEGVLKSWAVPKGPSLDPADKRLAVRTEDHPMDYIDFEGVIPAGEYGGGPVIVWDEGTYLNVKQDRQGRPIPMAKAIETGRVEIWLEGSKLRGGYALVRTRPAGGKEQWLLIKMRDEHADPKRDIVQERQESVKSGRTIAEVLQTSDDRRLIAKKMARASWTRAGKQEDAPAAATTAGRGKRRTRLSAPTARGRGASSTPDWIEPMLATLVEEPPPAKQWLFEPKLDGFRALAFRDGDRVRLLSRNKKDLGERFPEIVEALERQPVEQFVLDGEVVALNEEGVSSFSALQQRLTPISLAGAKRSRSRLYYYVFDLLFASGHDTRHLPQSERSKLLAQGVVFRDPIRRTDVLTGGWRELLEDACDKGWEGLIGKQANCPYVAGRTKHWVKLKCLREQEFVIGGWTDPEGSRTGFGSLLVGYYERSDLRYAGKVGTGYSDRTLSEMSKRLRTLSRDTSPFKKDAQIPRRGVHFVEPRLVASIAFTEWTHDEHIRHPRFRGLRDDKDAREVRREKAAAGRMDG